MSKLALFDPKDNCRVLQWLDTDALSYNLPDVSLLHQCTEDEWELRLSGEMMVRDGNVVPYVTPDTLLSQKKAAKWEGIKVERNRLQLEGGVKVGDHWFLSTERATGEYNSLIIVSQGMPDNVVLRPGWRTMDKSEVDMTPALARQILLAGIAQRCLIDDAALAHKSAMEASADPASYDYKAGWPAIYGEE